MAPPHFQVKDATMADNDDQAKALIEALAPKIAESILPQIAESVETQMKGLKEKNDELLDKLTKQKKHDAIMKAAEEGFQSRLNDDGVFQVRKPGDNIKITKSDARDVRAYREAKALADKEGVALEIVADV